jgi:cell division protein FtsQ
VSDPKPCHQSPKSQSQSIPNQYPNSQLVYQSPSKEQLKQRRRQLKQQRQVRAVISLWRLTCMSGILVGLAAVIKQLDWTISQPTQVRIQGNQYLNDEEIRSTLAISYPTPILELAPAQSIARLLDRGSISSVKIDRGLLPPHLNIQIQDLPPVARVLKDDSTESKILVDERGLQLPLSSYQPKVWQSLPKLRLRLPQGGICPNWTPVYHAVNTSPVAIGIIDCRNPQNLILQTEAGKVRLGTIGDKSRLNRQMEQLDRLRNWQKQQEANGADYLDLENPDLPKLQLKRSGSIAANLL